MKKNSFFLKGVVAQRGTPKQADSSNDKRVEIFCVKTESSDFRNEWDFEFVPPEQLPACFVYEYARELTRQWPRLLTLLAIREKRRQLPKDHPDRWKEVRVFQLICRIFSRRFSRCPAFWHFPDTPWQSIGDEKRVELAEEFNFYRGLHERCFERFRINTLRELEAANETSIEAFAYVQELLSDEELDQTECGFFAINWNYPDCEIESAFKSWLNEQREERTKRGLTEIKHRKTARGRFRDKLRWLGAMRVINHYPPGQLADLPIKVVDNPSWRLKVPAPYSYLPDLYEAARKAQRLIDGMRAATPVKPVKGKSLQGKLESVRRVFFPTDAQ
jgi:hypothetical protein